MASAVGDDHREPRPEIATTELAWQRPLRALKIGSVAVPLILLALWAALSWQLHYERATSVAVKNVDLVREYVLRVLQLEQLLLDRADETLTALADHGGGSPALGAALTQIAVKLPFTMSLAYVGPEGELRAATAGFPVPEAGFVGPQAAGAKAVFNQDLADVDAKRIVRISLGEDGRDVLVLAERPSAEKLDGLILVAVDIRVFTDFLQRIATRSGSAALLMREDGLVLLRADPAAPPLQLRPDAQVMQAIERSDRATYRGEAMGDGVERLYAISKVERLPLYVGFGTAIGTIRAEWLREAVLVAAVLAVFSGLGMLALFQIKWRVLAEAHHSRAEFDLRILDEAQRAAALKETLLQEMNHRIKNSLQTLQSLVRLRRGRYALAAAAFDEIEQRIVAIAQVHDLLYGSHDYAHVDLGTLIDRLCGSSSLGPIQAGVTIRSETEPLVVDVRQAVPAALIVLELITNAVKHAFPDGRAGTVVVRLFREGEEAVLAVRDDGVGLPNGGDELRDSGVRLVRSLAMQVGGSFELRSSDGLEAIVRMPIEPRPREGDAAG